MILSHPNAPQGEVKQLETYDVSLFTPPCAVLCRNVAPLVAFAYSLLHRDVPCRILGRDIGAQLKTIVEKMRATNLEDLSARLSIWHDREVTRAIAEDRSPERISDQFQCLVFFINGLDKDSRTVSSLLAKIDLMFTDDTTSVASRVTLSTVHKAKGLEFPTVFILDRHKYMPSKFAKQPWQRTQEKNLLYVAITRSMDKLYYISSDCWKETNQA